MIPFKKNLVIDLEYVPLLNVYLLLPDDILLSFEGSNNGFRDLPSVKSLRCKLIGFTVLISEGKTIGDALGWFVLTSPVSCYIYFSIGESSLLCSIIGGIRDIGVD